MLLLLARHISIHAPRTGSDCIPAHIARRRTRFQSTLPARGATQATAIGQGGQPPFQSTLPARGATPSHTPNPSHMPFQSTLPARGATTPLFIFGSWALCYFNPRSPHGERQLHHCLLLMALSHFNPRSPHGERQPNLYIYLLLSTFQSTLPARGATPLLIISRRDLPFQSTLPARGATSTRCCSRSLFQISIHAPRTGSDQSASAFQSVQRYFNPRSPHGERRMFCGQPRGEVRISIHAPRTGSDIRPNKTTKYIY